MSDQSQGPGWWVASDGKWYPPEQHPDVRPPADTGEPPAEVGGPPAGGPPSQRPLYRRPWFLITAGVVVVLLIAAIVASTRGSSSKEKVLSGTGTTTTSPGKPALPQTTATTATTAKPTELAVESGFASWLDSIGTRHSSAGAVVTNPNGGQAAYDVTAVFNLVDATGKVLDTESVRLPYIPAGGRVLAAPSLIGFNVNAEPSGVNVTAIGDFKKDTGRSGAESFSLNKGIDLTVTGVEIQHDQYSSKVVGQAMNPSSEIVKYASVTCVYRAGGTIVGGTATTIPDPIAPGATVAFNAGSGDLPPTAETAECTAVG